MVDAATHTVTWAVEDAHAHLRVDAYLALRLPWRSRRSLVELLRAGALVVNGRTMRKKAHRLSPGDTVSLTVQKSADAQIDLGAIELSILHEDDDLVVVNKAGDLAVHPASTCQYRNLLRRLEHHYQHERPDPRVVPSVVHRLDRTTSGVVVFAKRRELVDFYTRQFAARTTEKHYVAIVHGRVTAPLELRDPIVVPTEAAPCYVGPLGKASRTDVVARATTPSHTLVDIRLHTGRRHQIRVHLAHHGHPLVWDDLYAAPDPRPYPAAARPMLHAHMLRLDHRDGSRLTFTAPLADDLEQAWADRTTTDWPASAR